MEIFAFTSDAKNFLVRERNLESVASNSCKKKVSPCVPTDPGGARVFRRERIGVMRKTKGNIDQRCCDFLTLSRILLVLICVCAITNCTYEENTRVQIDGNVPPTFKLDGSGHQISLVVIEISPENHVVPAYRDPSKNIDLWEIVPVEGTPDRAWDWPPITYGRIPSGFRQKTPEIGVPPPLSVGRTYAAGGAAYGANGGEVWFTIRDGKSIEVEKPGGY